VPIVLATFPLTVGYPEGELIFDVVFFVVVLSVLAFAAAALHLAHAAGSTLGLTAAVAAGRAVSELGFGSAGTARGPQGVRERDARLHPPQRRVLDLLGQGAVRMAVAESETHGVLAVGRTLPIDGVSEVMGVATLPSARRRGLGAAVTRALTDDARALGVGTVFLTASSPEVARVYSRVGFRQVATAFAAEGRDRP